MCRKEDLYWRVCRMMTKDGAQEVAALAATSNFLPNYFPHIPPNTQHPVWPQGVSHPCSSVISVLDIVEKNVSSL